MVRVLLGIAVLCTCSAMWPLTTATSSAERDGTSRSLYVLQGDKVIIPEWDYRITKDPIVLSRIAPENFAPPAKVFRDRLLLEQGDVQTTQVVVPATAQHLVVSARGQSVEDVWPRIQVTFQPADVPTDAVLFQGFLQSRSLTAISIPIPAKIRGASGVLKIRMLNPNHSHGGRVAFIAGLRFEADLPAPSGQTPTP